MIEMHLRNTSINSIPVIELYREKVEREQRPIIIILHGFDSSKERKLQHAYIAAAAGAFVVLPDAVRHGDREDAAFAALSYEQKAGFLFDIVEETAAEIDTILDHYQQQSFIRTGDCGLIGTSMGGMIVYEYLARFGVDRIRASAVIISTPDFGSVIDRSLKNKAYENILSPSQIQRIKSGQPLPSILGLRDFPLYLVNAEDDPTIPIEPVRALYKKLHHSYSEKDTVRMRTYRDNGHRTTPEMMKESVEWLSKQLL